MANGWEFVTVADTGLLSTGGLLLGRGVTTTRLIFLVTGNKGPKVMSVDQFIASLNVGNWSPETMKI